MSIPPIYVSAARSAWSWQWNQLMKGLAPADKDGNYKRVPSQIDNAKLPNEQDLFSREAEDFPTLILGRSCPWAHRIWLIHQIKGLKNSLNIIFAKADYQKGQWLMEPSWLGCTSLLQLYKLCSINPTLRPTVPVLIDPNPNKTSKPKIIGNESAQLLEVLNKWPTKSKSPNLMPQELESEIKKWCSLLQSKVNDGVYKCGFARNQKAYNNASESLFEALHKIEFALGNKGPWLCGKALTIADLRLFPTLIRWESVYSPLFRCSKEPLSYFPNLLKWRKNFFQIPKVKETCNSEIWRNDYFGALFPLNPSNIVPNGPSISTIVNNSLL